MNLEGEAMKEQIYMRTNRRVMVKDVDIDGDVFHADAADVVRKIVVAYLNRLWPGPSEKPDVATRAYLSRVLVGEPESAARPTDVLVDLPFCDDSDQIHLSICLEALVDDAIAMHTHNGEVYDPQARKALTEVAAAFRSLAERLEKALEVPA